MASQADEGADPSDGTSFASLQDADASAFTALQMMSGSNTNLTSHFLPIVPMEVVAQQPGGSQTELSLTDDAILKGYMAHFGPALASTLVMTPQEMNLPTSSDSTLQANLTPHLTTLTLVPSNNLISMSASSSNSHALTTMSNLATVSASFTETSQTDLVTMIARQASGVDFNQPHFVMSGLQTEHHPLAPQGLHPVGEAGHHEELTSSQLGPPLESLDGTTVSILEEASREIQAQGAGGANTQNMVSEAAGMDTDRGFSVSDALYNEDDDDDAVPSDDGDEGGEGGCNTSDQPPILDENGEYKEEVTKEWSQMFTEQITPYFGYVNTIKEAHDLLKIYEMCTGTKFLAIKRCDLNKLEVKATKARPFRYTSLVICGEKIPFDGVPYYHGGKGMFSCHFGMKRKDPPGKNLKQRKMQLQSKKVGCTARAAFRVIARFPDYKLKENTEYNRLVASQTLQKALIEQKGEDSEEGGEKVAIEWRIYIMLAKACNHSNHEIIPTLRLREQPLDRHIVGRICQLVKLGLRDTLTIRKQVEDFAERVLTPEGVELKRGKGDKGICGSHQVWWYRKQIIQLVQTNKFQDSKFAEMVREVEELSWKHGYTGLTEDDIVDQDNEEDDVREGWSSEEKSDRWKKRTEKMKKKGYEKQLNELQMSCFAELERVTKSVQACRQVEVLARLLNCIKSGREAFEKELNIDANSCETNGNYGTGNLDLIQQLNENQNHENQNVGNQDHIRLKENEIAVNQAQVQIKRDQIASGLVKPDQMGTIQTNQNQSAIVNPNNVQVDQHASRGHRDRIQVKRNPFQMDVT